MNPKLPQISTRYVLLLVRHYNIQQKYVQQIAVRQPIAE